MPPTDDPRLMPPVEHKSSFQPLPSPQLISPDNRVTDNAVRPAGYIPMIAARPVSAWAEATGPALNPAGVPAVQPQLIPLVRAAAPVGNDDWHAPRN